ncbi:hypothetical protein, partial [Paraeggerthella hominis]|uniref:hypothetical protein n=1 Tax=Paraeggerthella hominis TaxID=2897351 RepID=UPI003D0A90AA
QARYAETPGYLAESPSRRLPCSALGNRRAGAAPANANANANAKKEGLAHGEGKNTREASFLLKNFVYERFRAPFIL